MRSKIIVKVKILYPELDGSIRFSKQEIQSLLDEVYKEGYEDGKKNSSVNYNPFYYGNTVTTPYQTLSSSSTSISSSDAIQCASSAITSAKAPFTYTIDFKG